ncbi:type I restriction enzyme HsdR N-terminal domain-containing protein [Chitinophagaceae bacterium LWZ2-11]
MIKIEYPNHPYKIREEQGKEVIFDEIRKLWVRLTPEEWVRQNFLQYLIKVKLYQPALIAVEKEIKLGELRKRCDIVVYKSTIPWMIIECKEMNVPLAESTLRQALNYNIAMNVQYLVITNGTQIFAWHFEKGKAELCEEIPGIQI